MSLVIEEKELDALPITVDPEIVSGTPVFRGTRVPVEALISNLEAGLTLDEFLENFPTVYVGTGTASAWILALDVAAAGPVQMKILLDECTPDQNLPKLKFGVF